VRLLLIEDDEELVLALRDALAKHGFFGDPATTLADARQMLAVSHYAAVIIDLGLPDGDGLTLIRELRASKQPIPIIAATARDSIGDRVLGLDSGADDYVVKPFAVEELASRLHAVLRRQGHYQGSLLECGNVVLDSKSGDLFVAGQHVTLAARERDLVELLMRRVGTVMNRQLAEDHLYGLSDPIGSNAVEVHIHRLRRKLEAAGADVRIETLRGIGYMMRSPQ
jgi:DNA-binding response OmpR family regulator